MARILDPLDIADPYYDSSGQGTIETGGNGGTGGDSTIATDRRAQVNIICTQGGYTEIAVHFRANRKTGSNGTFQLRVLRGPADGNPLEPIKIITGEPTFTSTGTSTYYSWVWFDEDVEDNAEYGYFLQIKELTNGSIIQDMVLKATHFKK